ncbi:hypothetical protein BJV40_001096 [Clostridium beijerinckii]|nr:hypothetical protein [Clostridium beijerinckii]
MTFSIKDRTSICLKYSLLGKFADGSYWIRGKSIG